jgi:hypothetical protein
MEIVVEPIGILPSVTIYLLYTYGRARVLHLEKYLEERPVQWIELDSQSPASKVDVMKAGYQLSVIRATTIARAAGRESVSRSKRGGPAGAAPGFRATKA